MDPTLRETRERIVREHMESENRHEFDVTLATFHHPRYEIVPTGDVYDGPEEVSAYFAETRAAFPDQRLWELEQTYRGDFPLPILSYGTVRDFADSRDHLPGLAALSFDMKGLQRCWMVKAILGMQDEPAPSHAADALAVAICHALAPPLRAEVG